MEKSHIDAEHESLLLQEIDLPSDCDTLWRYLRLSGETFSEKQKKDWRKNCKLSRAVI